MQKPRADSQSFRALGISSEEARTFFADGAGDDEHDDFSDLEYHPEGHGRGKWIVLGIVGLAVALGVGFFAYRAMNPYFKGGDNRAQTPPPDWRKKLAARVAAEDPVIGKGAFAATPRSPMRAPLRSPMRSPMTVPAAMGKPAPEPPPALPAPMAPDPKAAELGTKAEGLAKQRRWSAAEKAAEGALALDPKQPVASKVLAQILEARAQAAMGNGNWKLVLSSAKRAVKLDPTRHNAWLFWGWGRYETKLRDQTTKDAFNKYLALCKTGCQFRSYAQQYVRKLK